MQWLMLLLWGAVSVFGARAKARALFVRTLITAGLAVSMLSQLWLLRLDGQLTLATGLPLHLCGLFGLLSVPLLWRAPSWLMDFSILLGVPCAFLALCFPAVIGSANQQLMTLAFYRLHVLILCVPLLLIKEGKPLPEDPRMAFFLGNGYLLLVSAANRLLQTNYLFLRAAPAGTPLEPLFARGTGFYVCALEMLCMLMMAWLSALCRYLEGRRAAAAIAENT